jgi:hypothetical protein
MSEGWSWVRALESSRLTDTQLESLQAMVDEGEVDTLAEAARLLDWDLKDRTDSEVPEL